MLMIKDIKKMTAFGYACQYGYIDTIKVFLEFKNERITDIKKPDGTNKVEVLAVKKNAGVGPDRLTPLQWAAAKGNLDQVLLLLEHKARIQATDKYKRSALTLAVRNGHTKVASILL
jgi:ankyrin repeat protein